MLDSARPVGPRSNWIEIDVDADRLGHPKLDPVPTAMLQSSFDVRPGGTGPLRVQLPDAATLVTHANDGHGNLRFEQAGDSVLVDRPTTGRLTLRMGTGTHAHSPFSAAPDGSLELRLDDLTPRIAAEDSAAGAAATTKHEIISSPGWHVVDANVPELTGTPIEGARTTWGDLRESVSYSTGAQDALRAAVRFTGHTADGTHVEGPAWAARRAASRTVSEVGSVLWQLTHR